MKKIIFSVFIVLCFFVGFQFDVFASTDITDTSFIIDVDQFTPGGTNIVGGGEQNSEEMVNTFLGVVIEKLIIIFGVLAAFIMTIGAGYMILYHGEDELLSKGKSIFMAGIIAMVIALSAGIIVRIFAVILYS